MMFSLSEIAIVIIVLAIVDITIDYKSYKKEQKKLRQKLKEENQQKREYCEYFIKEIQETKSLYSLLNLHKLIWALGIRNQNIGPDKFGMFRTNDILKMTSQEVYLGNVEHLLTKTLADWSNNTKDEYQIVLNQYKNHLISNLEAIKLSL